MLIRACTSERCEKVVSCLFARGWETGGHWDLASRRRALSSQSPRRKQLLSGRWSRCISRRPITMHRRQHTPNAFGKRVSISGKGLIASGSTVLLYCNTSMREVATWVALITFQSVCEWRLSATCRCTIGSLNSLSRIQRIKESRAVIVLSYCFRQQRLRSTIVRCRCPST